MEKIKILLENSLRIFNVEGQLTDHIFNNKITVLNIFEESNFNSTKIVKNNKELQKMFSNQINTVDFIIKNNSGGDDISNLLNSGVENFINKNSALNPIVYLSDSGDFENNKIYIFDEKFNLKAVFQDNVDLYAVRNAIINVSKEKKRLRKLSNNTDTNYISVDENLIGEFSDFAIVEKNKLYDFSFFVILDSVKKKLLFTGLNGEIVNIVELDDFCLPNRIKTLGNMLYVVDSCRGEVKTISFEDNKDHEFTTLIKSSSLIGMNDFEFIDKNKVFVVKNLDDNLGIFDLKEKKYDKYDYKIGKISNIEKYNGNLYFFDYSNNAVYMLDENFKPKKILDFGENALLEGIYKFLLADEKNMYFVNGNSNSIYFYNGKTLEERSYDDFLYSPKNMIIYRNIYYILSENFIQSINFFNGTKTNIYLKFSKFFKYYDMKKVIENEKIFLVDEGILTVANNINLHIIYNDANYMENSPSFLNAFEIVDENTLKFMKSFFLNNDDAILNFEGKNGKRYLFYGKIFYINGNSDIKIKKVYKIVAFDEKNNENNTVVVMF
jgi:hypothetical protein